MQGFIIKLVLKLIELFMDKQKPKYTEGAGPGKLEKRLRAKIKKDGWE